MNPKIYKDYLLPFKVNKVKLKDIKYVYLDKEQIIIPSRGLVLSFNTEDFFSIETYQSLIDNLNFPVLISEIIFRKYLINYNVKFGSKSFTFKKEDGREKKIYYSGIKYNKEWVFETYSFLTGKSKKSPMKDYFQVIDSAKKLKTFKVLNFAVLKLNVLRAAAMVFKENRPVVVHRKSDKGLIITEATFDKGSCYFI